MKFNVKVLILAMLVFTCSSRLLTEGGEAPVEDGVPKEEHPVGEEKVAAGTDTPVDQAPVEPKVDGATGGEGTTLPAEHTDHKEGDHAGHKEGDHAKKDGHHDQHHDGKAQPKSKRFYILLAVSVLMIGAVCSAFILGKKKE